MSHHPGEAGFSKDKQSIDDGHTYAPIQVFRTNYQGNLLSVFTCPNRCGYGFGNASVGEGAHKALAHLERCNGGH